MLAWFSEDGYIFAESMNMNCSEPQIQVWICSDMKSILHKQLNPLISHKEIHTNVCKGDPRPELRMLGVWEVSLDIKQAFSLVRAVMNNSFGSLTGLQAAVLFQTGKLLPT